ncbi:MAG TPA: hypothetical protein VGC27_08715 [Rhizomicrobium sp.]
MHKMIAAAIADVRTDFAPARDIHMPVLEQNRSGPGSVDFDLNSPWVAFEPPIHGMAVHTLSLWTPPGPGEGRVTVVNSR